jgi:hypothetical protein
MRLLVEGPDGSKFELTDVDETRTTVSEIGLLIMHAYGDVRGISYVIERMNTSEVAETLNTTGPLKEANLKRRRYPSHQYSEER